MKPSFYSGGAGLRAFQIALNDTGNNLANVNTVGYKENRTAFQTLMSTEMYANTPTDPRTGHGVRALDGGLDFSQGTPRHTEIKTDFAIVGDGVFAVQTGDDRIEYTRDGSFTYSIEDGEAYLVTMDGAYVLSVDEDRITVPTVEDGETLDPSGLAEQIGVFSFTNYMALDSVMNNRFLPTEASGEATLIDREDEESPKFKLVQGALEQSGVSMVEEMKNLIMAQRAYQMSARVVQTSDEVEQTINNLRG